MHAIVNDAMLSAYLEQWKQWKRACWGKGCARLNASNLQLKVARWKRCVLKKSIPQSMPKNSICTKYVFALSMYLIRIAFHHSILRAIHTKNLQARIWIQWIPLFMHGVQFLKKITSPKNVLNSRSHGAHAGGRGCACAPAFFLYYYHPPHNFFRNMPPLMGFRFAHGYYGGKLITPTPITPTPPHITAQHGLVTEGMVM